ncbi:hypothetical protein ACQPXM_28950 [Kribbella sp. CA-253562]|uniref:hypothetical protein n=1 Tax=Kribbella sp. CA-253562 TaxID=3239942 RepID=UPI003D91805A
MLKRTLALTLLLTTQALPAPAAPAAIGPVTLAWSDATHTKVRITWTETTPVANTVAVGIRQLGTTTAAQPNQLVVDATSFPRTEADDSQQVLVAGSDGTEALSVPFDSYVYTPGDLELSSPSYDRMRWTVPEDDSVDGTPGDPLDLPVRYRYEVEHDLDPNPDKPGDWSCAGNTIITDVPTGTVARTGRPSNLWVRPVNEWGKSVIGGWAVLNAITGIKLAAPSATPYGGTTTLAGQVKWRSLIISGQPPTCNEWEHNATATTVVVHQRTSPTAPWTVVGTTRTDEQGNYRAAFRNPGHRQYRVVVANEVRPTLEARFGADSATVGARATTRVVSAKFIQPVVNLGTRPQAYLWVDPPGTQKAALQFRNASGAWQGVTYKTLYAGRGLIAFPWNKRGTTQFRWWVPATASADATYSGVFTLTVR